VETFLDRPLLGHSPCVVVFFEAIIDSARGNPHASHTWTEFPTRVTWSDRTGGKHSPPVTYKVGSGLSSPYTTPGRRFMMERKKEPRGVHGVCSSPEPLGAGHPRRPLVISGDFLAGTGPLAVASAACWRPWSIRRCLYIGLCFSMRTRGKSPALPNAGGAYRCPPNRPGPVGGDITGFGENMRTILKRRLFVVGEWGGIWRHLRGTPLPAYAPLW